MSLLPEQRLKPKLQMFMCDILSEINTAQTQSLCVSVQRFQPFITSCNKWEGDHTVGVPAYRHSPATVQINLSSVKLLLLSFINCGNCFHVSQNETLLQPFNVLHFKNSVCILLIVNSHTFHDFGNKFTFLLLVFPKSVEPNGGFALMTDLDVWDGFISPN
jgi:hypothetical protein